MVRPALANNTRSSSPGSFRFAGQRSLLVALREADDPGAALRWALEMASVLAARLHVLQVFPGTRYRVARRSTRLFVNVLRRARAAVPDRSETGLSWDPPGGHRAVIESAAVLQGEFVQQSAQYAAAINPALIVLANAGGEPGELATRLACSAQCPVLVARGPVGDPTPFVDSTVLAMAAIELFGHVPEALSLVATDCESVAAGTAVDVLGGSRRSVLVSPSS